MSLKRVLPLLVFLTSFGLSHGQEALADFTQRVTVLREAGLNEKALQLCNEQLQKLDPQSDPVFYLRAAHEKGHVLFVLGRFEEARDFLRPIKNMAASQNEDYKSVWGDCMYTLGRAYDMSDHVDSALYFFELCLKVREDMEEPNPRALAQSYSYLGFINCFILYNYSKAEKYYEQEGLELERFDAEDDQWARHYLNLTATYSNSDYQKSLNGYFKALSYAQAEEEGRLVRQRCYNNIANIYFNLTESQEAIRYYKLSLAEALKEDDGRTEDVMVFYSNLGMAYVQAGTSDSATFFTRKAFELSQDMYGENSKETAEAIFQLSLATDDLDQNRSYRKRAKPLKLSFFDSSSDEMASFHKRTANWFETHDQIDSALYYYQLALQAPGADPLAKPSLGKLTEPLPGIAYNLRGKCRSLFLLAKEIDSLPYMSAAIEHYKMLSTLNDRLLTDRASEAERLLFAEEAKNIYSNAVSAAFHYYSVTGEGLEDLWFFMEKSRSAVLLIQAQEANHEFSTSEDGELMAYMRELKGEAKYYEEMNRSGDYAQDSLRLRLFEINEELDSLKALTSSVRTEEYFQDILELADVPTSLDLGPNACLVECFQDNDRLYIMRVGSSSHAILLEAEDFGRAQRCSEGLLKILAEGAGVSDKLQQYRDFNKYATELYDLILRPLEVEGIEHITVVPDGFLATFPFETLLTSSVEIQDKVDYRSLPYLIKATDINYGYSASWLDFVAQNKSNGGAGLLAFAYAGGEDESALPGSADEVRALQGLWSSDFSSYIGTEASERNFKEEISKYQLLHLATHNEVDTSRPLNSGLVFRGDSSEDGILHVYEIYQLAPQTQMVVLSACESGLGEYREGEGYLSVGRAFAQMGTPNVVSSLWQTSDNHSRRLMQSFYGAISSGLSPITSLHQGKLEFLRNSDELGAHPSNWASYVLFGRAGQVSEIKTPTHKNHWLWIGVLLTGVMLFFFVRRLKTKP